MPDVHDLPHALVVPAAGYALALVAAVLGLTCLARARSAGTGSRRVRWLINAAFAIGGGTWLMHFTTMLGFTLPDSPVRYDVRTTAASAGVAVALVWFGLAFAGGRRRSLTRVLLSGLITGTALAATHAAALAALRVAGSIRYDPWIAAAAVLGSVVGTTVALAASVLARRRRGLVAAGALLALVMCGTHYGGLAALRIELRPDSGPLAGVDPLTLTLPIVVIVTVALVALVFSALQTVTEEDFGQPAPPRRPPVVPSPEPHPVSLAAFSATVPVPLSSTVTTHEAPRR